MQQAITCFLVGWTMQSTWWVMRASRFLDAARVLIDAVGDPGGRH
jgi:hypothetical protein